VFPDGSGVQQRKKIRKSLRKLEVKVPFSRLLILRNVRRNRENPPRKRVVMVQTQIRLHELDRAGMLRRHPMKVVYSQLRRLKARRINQVSDIDPSVLRDKSLPSEKH
jgi:hypothetical protein